MSTTRRVDALLDAVRDVELPLGARPRLALRAARPEYLSAFTSYLQCLSAAKSEADHWWQGLIDTERQRTADPQAAANNVRARRPHGPVVHPRVIHCIRGGWLVCQALNDAAPVHAGVAPEAFVLMWLEDANEHALVQLVSALPFWPIGQDDAGRWV
jgi:hypothetical protein